MQPPGVTIARIDPRSGLLAATGADGLDEVFLDGTLPAQAEAPAIPTAPGGAEVDPDKLLLERAP